MSILSFLYIYFIYRDKVDKSELIEGKDEKEILKNEIKVINNMSTYSSNEPELNEKIEYYHQKYEKENIYIQTLEKMYFQIYS